MGMIIPYNDTHVRRCENDEINNGSKFASVPWGEFQQVYLAWARCGADLFSLYWIYCSI